ncbi:hypothetical protein OF117_21625 [Geodermatophilus sp. YIM 151500]|uniref:hypothetical protein n=1 Tax=Geodermatophilus sp. YIM 151500 TaxID=2984531 RepID=UPI0021E3C742|nr:hypothetical protein [Geodermatophilus sp. YIM 151500]MCV2491951.1 hypothetical protein [Geodermatophilus sp. YIM 151500]
MTMAEPQALVATRTSWHRVAEHVLAAGQFAAAGTIRLRPRPGGFATAVGVGDRQLAVVGDELQVIRAGSTRSQRLTTVGDAARFAGVEPGLSGSYAPATGADPDAPLQVDPAAARTLADWFALGDDALRRLADDLGAPQDPVLWPEHFDVGVTVDGVNYGCSPGDAALPDPYLYVGPHDGPPTRDDFWNAPFGAALTADRVRSVDDALSFFHSGRDRLEGSRT